MTKTTRARYTLEVKQEAVRLVQGGQGIAAAARTGPCFANEPQRRSSALQRKESVAASGRTHGMRHQADVRLIHRC